MASELGFNEEESDSLVDERVSPTTEISLEASQRVGERAYSSERGLRNPRWTQNETLVLVHAKKAVNDFFKGYHARDQIATSTVRWEKVAEFCAKSSVERNGPQCKKRWNNVYTEYKKIRDHDARNPSESYWEMRWEKKRDEKLPPAFDLQVYEAMDSFLGRRMALAAGEKEELPVPSVARKKKRRDSEDQDLKQRLGNPPPPALGGKKKKTDSEDADFKLRLISQLEYTRKSLTETLSAQTAAQVRDNELDRLQRKEQADGLISVLGKLAESLSEIAKKL